MFQKLLVAYDGSAGSQLALAAALTMSQKFESQLHALAVIEHLPHAVATIDEVDAERERLEDHYRQMLEQARLQALEHSRVIETELRIGHPARTIVDVARDGAFDLVVLGHSGHSQAWALFLGTTAEKVSRHAPCSILIVR